MRSTFYRLAFWPFLQLIKGQMISKYINGLEGYYNSSLKFQEEYKLTHLRKLLQHCYENVPYYKDLFNKIDFKPSEVKSLGDLEKLPILTKELVRENYKDFICTDMSLKYVINSTSGSTGINLSLLISKEASERWYASKLYWRKSHGIEVGDGILWVWGRKIGVRNGLISFFKQYLEGEHKFSAFSLSQTESNRIAATINRKKIRIIYGYTSALYHLAVFLECKGWSFPSLKLIVVTAEGMTDSQKRLIENVFECSIISEYGAAEMGILSYECGAGKRHEIGYNNIIELVNLEDKEGDYKSIIVTDLFNYKMPLLRYNSGDLTSRREWHECDCGKNSWVMEPVKGREYDMIKLEDGNMVHGEAVNYAVKHTYMPDYIGILHTFIQEDIDRFTLILYTNFDIESLRDIESKFVKNISEIFNKEVSINFIYFKGSDYSYQGKHRFIVSHVK